MGRVLRLLPPALGAAFVLLQPACGLNSSATKPNAQLDRAALIFGAGPAKDTTTSQGGCIGIGKFTTWQTGTTITILASTTTMPESHIVALEAAAPQVSEASAGRLTAVVSRTATAVPAAAAGQIAVYTSADPVAEGCPLSQGCAMATYASNVTLDRLTSGKFIGANGNLPSATVHDVIGHLAMGLCHISSFSAGAKESLMSFGTGFTQASLPELLTARDIEAIGPAYAIASLDSGASTDDFAAAGLFSADTIASLARTSTQATRTWIIDHGDW